MQKSGLSMGRIYLSHSHPTAVYACIIPWDSHYIIIILIWNTIQLKLLNSWKFRFSIYQIGLHVQRDMQNDKFIDFKIQKYSLSMTIQ